MTKRKVEKSEVVFEQAWAYLDKKFRGQRNYEIIGFLETFKQVLIDEINDKQE